MSRFRRFKITPFTNPSGATAFRVTGRRPDGERVRENFKTRADAETRQAELEIEIVNSSVGLKPTRLTDVQLAEAEAAFQELGDKSLLQAVRYYLANYREEHTSASLTDAVTRYLTEKRSQNRRKATISELESITELLTKHYGAKQVHEVNADDLTALIFVKELKPRTQKHRRTKFGQFFNWAVKRRYCVRNPVSLIDVPMIDDTDPEAYGVSEVRALLSAARNYKQGRMLPYLVFGFFVGLRPTEIRRINWTVVNLEEKIVRLDGKMAKTRARRPIHLLDNVVSWLLPLVGKAICPPNWRKDLDSVRRLAGFKGSFKRKADASLKRWIFDGLRHTALSYHFAMFNDENETAKWAGNSPEVFHSKYKALVTNKEAREYWSITPASLEQPIATLPTPSTVQAAVA